MICDNIFTKCTYDGINLRIIYGDVIKKEKKKKEEELDRRSKGIQSEITICPLLNYFTTESVIQKPDLLQ